MSNHPPHAANHALLSGNLQRLRIILRDTKRNAIKHPALYGEDKVHVINLAAKLGATDALRACLSAGMVPTQLYNGFYPLHAAALHGHTEACKLLIAFKASVQQANEKGQTALTAAAINGHTATVEALVKLGADMNVGTNDGQTALTAAAINGHTATVEALVKLGADVNVGTNDGQTALTLAAINGHTVTVEALVRLGADVNAITHNGATALMLATLNAHLPTVEKLLQSGAGWSYVNNRRQTALDIARKLASNLTKTPQQRQTYQAIATMLQTHAATAA